MNTIRKLCHGPGLKPLTDHCMSTHASKSGFHAIKKSGDGAAYNGIRTWRCPQCFLEHRQRVRQANEGGHHD